MLLARKNFDYSTKESSKSTSDGKKRFFNLLSNISLIMTLIIRPQAIVNPNIKIHVRVYDLAYINTTSFYTFSSIATGSSNSSLTFTRKVTELLPSITR